MSLLSEATGLGKGSLYNFFPGGKEEMIKAVLADIERWFVTTVFAPLKQPQDPAGAITAMIAVVTTYFQSGGRICLVGLLGLSSSSDTVSVRIRSYLTRWSFRTGPQPGSRPRSAFAG